MKSVGDSIIDAVVRADAIERVIANHDSCIFVWRANAAEQIEAALREMAPHLHITFSDTKFNQEDCGNAQNQQ